ARLLTGDADRRDAPRISPAPEANHATVPAPPRHVEPGHQHIIRQGMDRALLRLADGRGVDELKIGGRRWEPLDANADEIAVLAVVLYPLLALRLVREARFAGVNGPCPPAIPLRPEAPPMKRALTSRRIAEQEDHRL